MTRWHSWAWPPDLLWVGAALAVAIGACGGGAPSVPPSRASTDEAPPARPSEPVTERAAPEVPAQAAWVLVDLRARRVIQEARPDVLDTPVQPGSLMKIVTLEAAAASGLVSRATRLACPRRVRVGDRVLDCAHPDLGRPLSASEALAHSCNGFFAQVAPRVSRAQLDAAARRLGLPPMNAPVDPVLGALGLDVYLVPPRRWVDVVAALGEERPRGSRPVAVEMIRDGMRDAAQSGTASTLGLFTDLLAKTGTAAMPGGGVEGLAIVGSDTRTSPRALVVVAPGGSGRDAATIASAILARAQPRVPPGASVPVRLGVMRGERVEVREVSLEDYVADVVTGEAPVDGSRAVREAMAIAARTVVAERRGRHAREGFDVCDTTHCQVVRPASAVARAAALATAGLVVTVQGHVAEIYYAASCGGVLADPKHVWPGRQAAWPAYLAARPDPAGDGGHEVRWEAELPVALVIRVLQLTGLRGDRVDDLEVLERDATGRARFLRAAGFTPETVGAEAFRMAAGRASSWGLVKSTWFDLARTASGYRLSGRGLGHGVGLCVRGAAALAARGQEAAGILQAYFPGTVIQPLEGLAAEGLPGIVRVVLPASDERFRTSVEAEATAFLRQASARLGVPPPPRVTIRFHPTVASYQRATGRPWWTSATTAGARIDLVPAPALEARRQLERSLRHEIVHVVTAASLQGKPLWVLEGVARHFTWASGAGQGRHRLDSGTCPDDAAFASAGSADDLDRLYERSAACVAGALAAGRGWRELP